MTSSADSFIFCGLYKIFIVDNNNVYFSIAYRVTVITALKTKEEYASTNVMTPPNWLNISNFITAWKDANMGLAFRNTLIILVFVLFGSIMFGSMLAYIRAGSSSGEWIYSQPVFICCIDTRHNTQVTVYQIMHALNLINTLHGYIIS